MVGADAISIVFASRPEQLFHSVSLSVWRGWMETKRPQRSPRKHAKRCTTITPDNGDHGLALFHSRGMYVMPGRGTLCNVGVCCK